MSNLENQEANAADVSGPRTALTSPRDVLIAARGLIEKPERWCGGGEQYDFSRACAGVAIDRAGRAAVIARDHRSAAVKIFREVIGTPDIIDWNDTPGRTHAEVLAAFDAAIAATGDRDTSSASTERA